MGMDATVRHEMTRNMGTQIALVQTCLVVAVTAGNNGVRQNNQLFDLCFCSTTDYLFYMNDDTPCTL
jgi:hypothetical protein